MKFLDRLALKIFSLIIFVIVVAMILLFIGVISINDIVMDLIRFTDGPHSIEIIFGILGVLMIFAIKTCLCKQLLLQDNKYFILCYLNMTISDSPFVFHLNIICKCSHIQAHISLLHT